jgi:hypothetical protein
MPNFAAAYLTKESKQQLISWWTERIKVPLHAVQHCEHMTLAYQPSADELSRLPKSAVLTLEVIGYAADARGQAVVVRCRRVSSRNVHPHITVATGKRDRPAYSKTLLSTRGWTAVEEGPVLVATIGTAAGTISPLAAECVRVLDLQLPCPPDPPNIATVPHLTSELEGSPPTSQLHDNSALLAKVGRFERSYARVAVIMLTRRRTDTHLSVLRFASLSLSRLISSLRRAASRR